MKGTCFHSGSFDPVYKRKAESKIAHQSTCIGWMSNVPVHSASNDTVFIKNLNSPCEILAQGGDRPPAENDSREH